MIHTKRGVFLVFIIFLLYITPVLAEDIDYKYIKMNKTITYLGETNTYYFDITSNIDETKTFIILPNPIYHKWFISADTIQIELSGTKRMEVIIAPPSDTVTGTYYIVFRTCVKDETTCSKNIRIPVYVIDRNQLIFETMIPVKDQYFDNEDIEIFFRLNNTRFSLVEEYSYKIDIYDSKGTIIKSHTEELPLIDRHDLYAKTVNLGKINKDKITIEMSLIDAIGTILQKKNATVNIKEYIETITPKEPSINIEEKPGAFYKTTTITIRNKNYFDHQTFYTDRHNFLKEYMTRPTRTSGNDYIFECNMKPFGESGDTCEIKYKVNYWKLYIPIIAIMIIIIEIYFNMTKPIITKKDIKKNGYHNIHLNIINKSPRTIYNATITDTMPASTKATGHFSLKIKDKKSIKTNTQLKWNLGTLKPKEQRIISYTIKPRFEIKSGIKLQGATLTGKNKNNKPIKIRSNKLIIKT